MEDVKHLDYIELEFTRESDFVTTKHLFRKDHYELAVSIANSHYGNLSSGTVFVHPNLKDLYVGFELSDTRLDKAMMNNLYRVIIQCPENSIII